MSKIEDLIKQYCPNGCEWKTVGECVRILDGQRKPITKAARIAGKYPYYGANGVQDYVADYIFDGTYVLVGEDGSVVTPEGYPIVHWVEGKIWVNNHAHIVEEIQGVSLRYFFHAISNCNVSNLIHGNIPKLNQGDFRAIQIPVPPLPVQEEIVHILDSFTELETELEKELEMRKKQYEWYRDELLTFGDDVERKTLGDVADIYDGVHQTPTYTSSGVHFISVENIDDIYNSQKYISREDFEKYKIKPCIGDVFMTRIGTVGKCAVMKRQEDLAYYVSLALIRPDCNQVMSEYLKHVIESVHGAKELAKRTLIHAVPIKINKDSIGDVVIPVPPLQEQQRIVEILDTFDTLTTDLTQGLPAEIKMRRMQYEYYRDYLFGLLK